MTIVFAILLFSFLIFIHELGHFVAAKLSGVQVNEFSMFMGPAIVKWQRGETKYAIRCIPIGGYCAMEGEDKDTDNPRSFQKAAWWKRLIILLAGSAMNFVAGVLLMAIVLMPMQQIVLPQIATAEPDSAVIGENALQLGDRILQVDGEKIYVASDFNMILTLKGGDVHDLVVQRGDQTVHLNDFKMEKRVLGQESTPRYGFSFAVKQANFADKLQYTWNSSINVVRSVRLSLQMLLTGQAGIRDVSGPVGIVQIMSDTAEASETAQDAFMNMLYFGAFIAINLAVMNLLPLPALDGGRAVCLLLTAAVEGITKKKINPKYEGYIHAVGMVLLLILMAVIMFKDIFFIFKR